MILRFIRIVLYLLLILLAISFAALNANSVTINLYVTTLSLPISLLMAIMSGIGLLMGLLLSLAKYWRLKIDCSKTKNQLKITEKEIKNLRNIPLKDQH